MPTLWAKSLSEKNKIIKKGKENIKKDIRIIKIFLKKCKKNFLLLLTNSLKNKIKNNIDKITKL